jgi:hypothetical protein
MYNINIENVGEEQKRRKVRGRKQDQRKTETRSKETLYNLVQQLQKEKRR